MPSVLLYMVYDKDKNDKRIGNFTPEVANIVLGIKKNQVSVYANEGRRYKSRYLFVAEPREPSVDELCADWDNTVKKIKALTGGGKRGS